MFCEPNFKNRDMNEAIDKSVIFPGACRWTATGMFRRLGWGRGCLADAFHKWKKFV
jgi:hypothetical protein